MAIKRQKRLCAECNNLRFIFSKGRCKACASKEYSNTAKANRKKKQIKKSITRKKKKVTITTLKAKLWRIFSKYVRLRDSDKDGYCKCITCGKRGFWTKDGMEAGHFRSRRYNSVFIHERNVHAQCTRCNGYNQGESYLYGKELDKRYGEGYADKMVQMSFQEKKFTTFELEQLCKEYAEKTEIILRKKNI